MTHPQNLIEMGYVSSVFGIKGWVKIKTTTEYDDSLDDYENIYLKYPNGTVEVRQIENSFVRDGIFHAKLIGIDDRDVAFGLKGAVICADRDDFPAPEEDEFYWVDLIGLAVKNLQNEDVGVVKELMETGANDVLVVIKDKEQRLIPFVSKHVINVNLEQKEIIVDWGLDY